MSGVSFVLLYNFVLICALLYFWSRKVSASFSNMCVCAASPSCFAMVVAFRISWYCFCFLFSVEVCCDGLCLSYYVLFEKFP